MIKQIARIFLYTSGDGCYISAGEGDELSDYLKGEGYYRITKPTDVEFELLPKEEVVAARIRDIDSKIDDERKKLNIKIMALDSQKAELLAITFEPEPEFDPKPEPVLQTYYATLGSDHSFDGESGPGYVEILAYTESDARRLINKATKNRWAFMYDVLDKIHPLDRICKGVIDQED